MEGCLPCRRADVLRDLEQRIRVIEDHTGRDDYRAVHAAGAGMPALASGTLHEWCGVADAGWCAEQDAGGNTGRNAGRSVGGVGAVGGWTPPLLVLVHLARLAFTLTGDAGWVVWIGRSLWPHPRILAGHDDNFGLLRRSLFIDAADQARRVWAVDLALRCPAVCAIVADGSGLRLPHTRRLQLAAEAGDALVLLARPPGESHLPTSAGTRWVVTRARSPGAAPRWDVNLVRCKGVQRESAGNAASHWLLEWDRETGCLHLPADVVDRPAATTPARRAG